MTFSSSFISASKLFVRGAGVFVFTVGLTVLIGWIFDIHSLKSVYGPITMKANTALCLLLSGSGLFLLKYEQKGLQLVGQAFAAGVAIIGALTLSQHLFGWDLGIDQLLFKESPGAIATTSPGRMGPPASTCFLLSGIALILFYRSPKSVLRAQILSLLVFLWSLFVIMGYTYGAEQLYGVARFTGIALNTVVALCVLAVGLLAAKPDQGFMAVISREHAGGAMARRLLLPALFVPFLLGWIRLLGQRAGYYDVGFGTAISMLAIIYCLLFSIWRTAATVDRMEQKRLSAESALRTTQNRFDVAIKNAPLTVYSQDSDLRYTWVFTNIYGLSDQDVRGKKDEELLPASDAEVLRKIKLQVLNSGVGAHQEVKIHHSNKDHFYNLTVEPLVDSSGRNVGVTCAAIDITEMKHIEAQLRRANQLKDEFLTTLSHELRTPLNSILGWATVLQSRNMNPAMTAQGLDAIVRSARAQARIIEDLLDVSRIISGKLHLEVQPIQLSHVVRAALDSLGHAIESKDIQIQTMMNPDADQIVGDPVRLQQVLWNILSNAIKFTPRSGRVEIQLARVDSKAELTVTDTGEGIKPEFLPYVFDRFQQADGSITRRHSGLGLGLAIVRHLVELHGGSVAAFSEGPQKGATFRIQLPLVALAKAEPEKAGALAGSSMDMEEAKVPQNSHQLKGRRILAVDDEADARDLLQAALHGTGADVATVASASEAIRLLSEWKPHLIVCDIGMPEEDGFSVIRKIRSFPAGEGGDIPAIALTGYARAEDRLKAEEAGFQMFFPKPVKVHELISVITKILKDIPG